MQNSEYHQPVMLKEVLTALGGLPKTSSPKRIIDATLGTGGYSQAILETGGEVLGIDFDPKMVAIAKTRLESYGKAFTATVANFVDIEKVARKSDFYPVDGVVFDLGVSNLHFKDSERGFSFANPDANLDMRLNPDIQNVRAADLLNILRPDQLKELFLPILGWRGAKTIVEAIIKRRQIVAFSKVRDLLYVSEVLIKKPGLNQATLAFLAVRIAVNSELSNLDVGLDQAFNLVKSGGKILVVSFHSLENKKVSDFAKNVYRQGLTNEIVRLEPSSEQILANPKARSATLTVIQKI